MLSKFERPVSLAIGLPEDFIKSPEPEGLGHLLKNLVDIRPPENILFGVALSESIIAVRPVLVAREVIVFSFFRIGEDGIGLVDLLHLLHGRRVFRVLIRMVLKGPFSVGLFDLLLTRILADPKRLVKIFLSHHTSTSNPSLLSYNITGAIC